jgi:hypothetical protein
MIQLFGRSVTARRKLAIVNPNLNLEGPEQRDEFIGEFERYNDSILVHSIL